MNLLTARKIIVILLVSLLMISGSVFLSGCEQGKPAIDIEAPMAMISPMIVGSGSVFMRINNTGNADDVLVNARAIMPNAITEMHDVKDGKMLKTAAIRVPARNSVLLRPGSLHIMLFNMPREIGEGDEFMLQLFFEKSGMMQVPIKFQKKAFQRSGQ